MSRLLSRVEPPSVIALSASIELSGRFIGAPSLKQPPVSFSVAAFGAVDCGFGHGLEALVKITDDFDGSSFILHLRF